MKLTLPALVLLLLLNGCASTKPVAYATPQASPISTSPAAAIAETVVLSPTQLTSVTRDVAPAAPVATTTSTAPAALVNRVAVSAAPPGTEQVQQVPFQVSVSSVTVERLAKQQGCKGGKGASLVTEKGPVEVYKMVCDSGRVFLAKCELRQCKSFNW